MVILEGSIVGHFQFNDLFYCITCKNLLHALPNNSYMTIDKTMHIIYFKYIDNFVFIFDSILQNMYMHHLIVFLFVF